MKYDENKFETKLIFVLEDIKNKLIDKNRSYGNSAIEPVRIFSKVDPIEQLNIRIDDKLSRFIKGDNTIMDEDTERDLLGYLILKQVAKIWNYENK